MRVFLNNSEGTTYVSDPKPKDRKFILALVKIVAIAVVCVTALIICKWAALVAILFISLAAIGIKE